MSSLEAAGWKGGGQGVVHWRTSSM